MCKRMSLSAGANIASLALKKAHTARSASTKSKHGLWQQCKMFVKTLNILACHMRGNNRLVNIVQPCAGCCLLHLRTAWLMRTAFTVGAVVDHAGKARRTKQGHMLRGKLPGHCNAGVKRCKIGQVNKLIGAVVLTHRYAKICIDQNNQA